MFLNYSVADSYNREGFEFSMGPNSILFRDGQIGGLATSSTKLPRFEGDLYSGTPRWDSWGGWRFTADANKNRDEEIRRALGQGANPLLGMFPSGYNYLDPRKIMMTTAIDF